MSRGRPLLVLFELALFAVSCLCGAKGAAGEEAGPEDVRTVAVLNFVNRNPGDGWDWLGTGLADSLITDLSKSASLTVVERERMAWTLKEMEIARRGIVDPAAAQNVGRICKVDCVLFGSFLKEFPKHEFAPRVKEMLEVCATELQKRQSSEKGG